MKVMFQSPPTSDGSDCYVLIAVLEEQNKQLMQDEDNETQKIPKFTYILVDDGS